MDDEASELILSSRADSFLSNSCTSEERFHLLIVLFSLLLDPSPDNVNKFEADYYPYTGRGVREYLDEDWYLAYVAKSTGPVNILIIRRRRDLPLKPNP